MYYFQLFVILLDGYTYERSAIVMWINSGKNTSPMTNTTLPHINLIPNRPLKSAIYRFFGPEPLNFIVWRWHILLYGSKMFIDSNLIFFYPYFFKKELFNSLLTSITMIFYFLIALLESSKNVRYWSVLGCPKNTKLSNFAAIFFLW